MIFVDSSFLIAGMIRRDRRHPAARRLTEQLEGRPMVTTTHVRGETWTWLRRRAGHARAVGLLNQLGGGGHIRVVSMPVDMEDEALLWLRLHDEREYSYVDATSFAFMRREGITEALAFDGAFSAAGFTELRP